MSEVQTPLEEICMKIFNIFTENNEGVANEEKFNELITEMEQNKYPVEFFEVFPDPFCFLTEPKEKILKDMNERIEEIKKETEEKKARTEQRKKETEERKARTEKIKARTEQRKRETEKIKAETEKMMQENERKRSIDNYEIEQWILLRRELDLKDEELVTTRKKMETAEEKIKKQDEEIKMLKKQLEEMEKRHVKSPEGQEENY